MGAIAPCPLGHPAPTAGRLCTWLQGCLGALSGAPGPSLLRDASGHSLSYSRVNITQRPNTFPGSQCITLTQLMLERWVELPVAGCHPGAELRPGDPRRELEGEVYNSSPFALTLSSHMRRWGGPTLCRCHISEAHTRMKAGSSSSLHPNVSMRREQYLETELKTATWVVAVPRAERINYEDQGACIPAPG